MGSKKYRNRIRRLKSGEVVAPWAHAGGGGKKLSAAIIDVAQPLLDEATEFQDHMMILGIAACAWSMALLPTPQMRATEILAAIKKMGFSESDGATFDQLKQAFEFMIERRLELYPDDSRIALTYEFVDAGNGKTQFNVVGTLS